MGRWQLLDGELAEWKQVASGEGGECAHDYELELYGNLARTAIYLRANGQDN